MKNQNTTTTMTRPSKVNRTTAAMVALFLGGFGLHRFMVGQPLKGLLYLLFCWTFIPGIIAIIDALIWIMSSDLEFDKKYNPVYVKWATWEQEQREKDRKAMAKGSTTKTAAEQLTELSELVKKGTIDQEQFEKLKAKIID